MKGLTQFIIDIRNTQDAAQERKRINQEINNIQTKFSSNLSSYQRKKYVCKLMYISLMGYDDLVEFGVKECLQLASAKNYQEKAIGYLGLLILLNPTNKPEIYFHQLLDLLFNQLMVDLKIDNEIHNKLALEFIANNFNFSLFKLQELAIDQLANQVYSFAISPMTPLLLKKKSLICLRNLIQLNPRILVENDNWVPRILSLVDFGNDLSVILNGLPIIEIVLDFRPNLKNSVMSSVINLLNELVINKNLDETFYYYKLPAPWLIIKLLKILENSFVNDVNLANNLNDKDLKTLKLVISNLINQATNSINSLSNKNLQSSMLFQSVILAIFCNASIDSILGALQALIQLLKSNDTNTRYLSLDVLTKLIGRCNDEVLCKKLNSLIFNNLGIVETLITDKDISIKRKALDLFYIITDEQNYQIIINKFMDFFPVLDFQLKSELSIKIAVLSEKFAQDSTWYVNIMIKLLSIPNSYANSDYLNNEIWERIIQIIVNNDELHLKTCRLLLNKLSKTNDAINDNLIKISAFVIGEYGPLLVNEYPPIVQFQLLYNAYMRASTIARGMILSLFFKFLNYYKDEDFVANIIDLFEVERDSLDLEIQTRANEYLNLFMLDSPTVLSNIIKPLPPFETKQNHLMARIGTINSIVGTRSNSFVNATKINKNNNNAIAEESVEDTSDNPFEDKLVLSPNWYSGYHRMLHYDAGIFYENQLVRITYKLERSENHVVRYKFHIINNSYKSTHNQLTSFKILQLKSNANSVNPSYLLLLRESPDQIITDKSNIEIEVRIRKVVGVDESPTFSLSFNCGGSFTQLNLKFPVNVLKTLTPTDLQLDEFKNRWLQISQFLPEIGEYTLTPESNHKFTTANVSRLLHRIRFSVVFSSGEETDKLLVLAAGILHTQNDNFGVLLSIKSIDSQGKKFEITAKCTGEGVLEVIVRAISELFQGKI